MFEITKKQATILKRVFKGAQRMMIADGEMSDWSTHVALDAYPEQTAGVHVNDARSLLVDGSVAVHTSAPAGAATGYTVTSGARTQFVASDTGDMVRRPELSANRIVVDLSSPETQAAVRQLNACRSTDDMVPVLMGALVESRNGEVNACSTDRYRAAHAVLDGNAVAYGPDITAIVDGRLLREASTVKRGTLTVTDTYSSLDVEGMTIFARNIDGSYPRVVQLFPDDMETCGTVEPTALVAGVKELRTGKNDHMVVSFAASQPEVWAVGTSAVHVAGCVLRESEEHNSVLNSTFVSQIMQAFHLGRVGDVEVSMSAAGKPVLFGALSNRLRVLLMPINRSDIARTRAEVGAAVVA